MKLLLNGEYVQKIGRDFFSFHGTSVFTTLRSQNKNLLLWDAHWKRINSHAQFFNFVIPDETRVLNEIHSFLATESIDQKIRIIISNDRYALTFEDYAPPHPSVYCGVRVITSRYVVHPQFAQFKTGNSLPYMMALTEAQSQGAFEALLKNNDGYVVDGSRTSILMIKEDALYCVSGGLESCMRDHIVCFARNHNIPVVTTFFHEHELDGQLLLANSLMGLVPVAPLRSQLATGLVSQFRMDH